jgi:hypothetical protein
MNAKYLQQPVINRSSWEVEEVLMLMQPTTPRHWMMLGSIHRPHLTISATTSSSLDESKVKAGALHQTTDLRAPQSPAVLTDECHKRY